MLRFDRKQQNSAKQLSFSKKKILKRGETQAKHKEHYTKAYGTEKEGLRGNE